MYSVNTPKDINNCKNNNHKIEKVRKLASNSHPPTQLLLSINRAATLLTEVPFVVASDVDLWESTKILVLFYIGICVHSNF